MRLFPSPKNRIVRGPGVEAEVFYNYAGGLMIHWTGLTVAQQYIGMTRNNLYIISTSLGTRIGGFVKNGDKIHLLNQFQTKSYLDTYVGLTGKYELQTSTSPNRDSGSGTWEIVLEGCINQKGKIWEKTILLSTIF